MVLLICKKLHLWPNVQPQSRPDGFPWVFDPSRSQLSQRGPNCADDVSIRGARARALYRNIISTIGTSFWLNWDQEGCYLGLDEVQRGDWVGDGGTASRQALITGF